MFRRSRAMQQQVGDLRRAHIYEEATRCRVAPAYETGTFVRSLEERKMNLLPTTAEQFYEDASDQHCSTEETPSTTPTAIMRKGWEPIIQTILMGTREDNPEKQKNSPITMFRNHEDTLVRYILSFLHHPWAKYVKLTVPAALVGSGTRGAGRMYFIKGRHHPRWQVRTASRSLTETSSGYDDGFVSFAKVGRVIFPRPNGRNVNMMPFILGDKTSLPTDLQCYHSLIEQCPYSAEEKGKVGYLTVHESYVDVGKAQRREGLHIEAGQIGSDVSKNVKNDDDQTTNENNKNSDDDKNVESGKINFTPAREHAWGMGMFYGDDNFEGGIYMASSVANTSQVWDALVDNRVPGIVDKHGGCEHLRNIIGPGTMLGAGELIWMTDLTPHEAVPQRSSGHRRFFRVVGPCISHWYEQHSTRNPKVPLPDHVQIIKTNKFEAS